MTPENKLYVFLFYNNGEDGDKLVCYRVIPTSVGGCGYMIHNHLSGERSLQKKPAGLVCTPFSAEVRATIYAIREATENCPRHSRIRWMVDCQGICVAISKVEKQDSMLLYQLRRDLQAAVDGLDASTDIVWISSHCGIDENEEVDALAREALNLPFKDQLQVPIDFRDTKVMIRKKQKPISNDLGELPEAVQETWTSRKAKVP